MQDIIGGLFTRTELSEVLTEIVKMDPNFCKEQFLKDCERDIIPNVLVRLKERAVVIGITCKFFIQIV
jgi:hypothetical protein